MGHGSRCSCDLGICGDAFSYLSMACFDLKEIPEAIKNAEEAFRRNPNHPDYIARLEGLKKFEALSFLKKVMSSKPAIDRWPQTQAWEMHDLGRVPDSW